VCVRADKHNGNMNTGACNQSYEMPKSSSEKQFEYCYNDCFCLLIDKTTFDTKYKRCVCE
jgi:hypothetical protein